MYVKSTQIFKNLENALAEGHNASKNMQQMAFDAYFVPRKLNSKAIFHDFLSVMSEICWTGVR